MGKVKLIDEFEFISEKPLKASSNIDLSFGHKEIVSVLKRIVKKTPESFTIGLYGDWGSGKSTIAVSLKDELRSDGIPLVIFDVWKHEGDSLRRTFLSLLVNDLKKDYENNVFKSDFELSDRNNNSQTINEEVQKLSWNKIAPHFYALLIISFGLLIPFFLFWLIFDKITGWLSLSETIGQLIVSGFSLISFSLFFKYLNQFIDVKKITTSIDKFKDPHEFEEEFKRILKDGLNVSKIVIVFDNLDRVNGDKALEIMSTIKTFLDPIDRTILNRDVTFIIPCDEKAIKRHLKKSLNYSDDDDIEYERYSSEYLRKFFNSIIWIPEFYTNELEKLASKSLKETKIKELDNDDIAALIVLVFDKNPRQIIQYVNILTSNYLLIKERNIEGIDLNSDISQYAKYLLLIQTFPDMMNYLKANSIYDLNEVIKLDIEEQKKLKNYDDFIKFLDLTNHIKIDSLDVFFKLRKSEFDVDFGNSDKLIRLIQNQEINNVIGFILADESGELNLFKVNNNDDINYIKDLNIAVKKTAFNSIIKQKLSKINNQILIAKFIDGLLSLMKYKDVDLDINTYRTLNDKFKKGIESMYFINPDNLLTQVIDKISDNTLKNHFLKLMKDKWVFYINSFYNDQDDTSYLPSGYNDRLWDVFIDKNNYFLESDFKIVRETIALKLSSDIDFVERISESTETRKKLSSSKCLFELLRKANFFRNDNVFPSKIQFNDELLIISKVSKVVSKYEDRFFDKTLNEEVYRFLNFNLESINNLNKDIGDENLLIDSLFELFSKKVIQKNNFEVQLQQSLYTIIHMNFIDSNYKYSNHFFKFYYTYFIEIKDDVNKNIEITNFICDFFDSNIKADFLTEVIETATTLNKIFGVQEFESVFFKNSINQFDFLETFYQYFTNERKQDIIESWVNSDPKVLNEFLNKIDYTTPNPVKFADSILILTKNKEDYIFNEIRYNILFKLRDLNNYDFINYSEQIISLIISNNVSQQELGLRELIKNKKYINEYHLKDNCENVLKNTYLDSLDSYCHNVKNIYKTEFGGKKKFINEIWNDREGFKDVLVDYFFNYVDEELFVIFSSSFFKLNFIEFGKMLINKYSGYSMVNKNIFNKFKPILKSIISSKYKKEFAEELSLLIEKYDAEVSENVDEIIIEAKQLLN